MVEQEGSPMGRKRRGRYRGPKGVGFEGISEYEPENEASLDEAFEEAAAAVQDAIDDEDAPETEEFFATTFDVSIEVQARRHNQNVKVYRVIITTPHT
jgi:hypothetical protein